MSNYSKIDITIMGCGLAGCFMAIMLAKRGYRVNIYERYTKEEIVNTNSKRSFNLTLYGYAIQMLKEAGLWKKLQPHMLPLKGSSTQVTKFSEPIFSAVDHDELPYYTVSRGKLIENLLAHAEKQSHITFHYETMLHSIDRYAKTIVVEDLKKHELKTISCSVVFGADGVNSVVRPFIQQGQETSHSQEYASWTYKQFAISQEQAATLNLKKDVAYTWSRKHAFIISFPNQDGSFAGLLVLPEGKNGFHSLQTPVAIRNLIEDEFPLLRPILPDITVSLLANPEGNFVTIHTDPWYYKGFLALVGDAAHGFYPFFGQGTSAAFGDCMEIIRLMDKYGTDWSKIFPLYEAARKPHMDALGEVSKEGFRRYLRNKRADYAVIYDRIEQIAHSFAPRFVFPPLFLPVMVDPANTATHVANHKKQRRIARYLAIPLFIALLTGFVALQEYMDERVNISALKKVTNTYFQQLPSMRRISYQQAQLISKPLIIILLSLLHTIS